MAQTTDSSVISLITAFTSGLDVFKKLRERRRAGKTRRTAKKPIEKDNGEELRLSRSLRRGPVDIQNEYERHVERHGERYAVGDAVTNTSLAQTLIKLNTGLVSIISSFLCSKSNDVHLDYKSLTSLSDCSRLEAIDALSSLSQRISQSRVSPPPSTLCPCCGRGSHHGVCARGAIEKTRSLEALRVARGKRDIKDKQMSSKGRARKPVPVHPIDEAHEIRKVHLSSASEPQLAMVRSRPKNRRTSLSSSDSSQFGSAASSRAPPPAYTSPLASPSFPPPSQIPTTCPPPQALQPQGHRRKPRGQQSATPQHSRDKPVSLQPVSRRRADKPTPSTFTFASDSTKLGEIPMAKWNLPFDVAEMQRLNADYYSGRDPNGWEHEEKQKKIGLFGRMFRKKKEMTEVVAGL